MDQFQGWGCLAVFVLHKHLVSILCVPQGRGLRCLFLFFHLPPPQFQTGGHMFRSSSDSYQQQVKLYRP